MKRTDVLNEVYFENAKEMYESLSPFGKFIDELDGYIFRGESSSKYKLLPSALRETNKRRLYDLAFRDMPIDNQSEWESWQQNVEMELLRRFYRLADNKATKLPDIPILRNEILNMFPMFRNGEMENIWIPGEFLELASLAQHFGIPTRLLDWTTDLYIALYFAVSGTLNSENMEDYVVLWALDNYQISFLEKTEDRIPLRITRPSFHRNENLTAQSGVLLHWEYPNLITIESLFTPPQPIDRTPIDEKIINYLLENEISLMHGKKGYRPLIYKFYLPASEAKTLYRALIATNYGADKIYAGLSGVLQRMKDDAHLN